MKFGVAEARVTSSQRPAGSLLIEASIAEFPVICLFAL